MHTLKLPTLLLLAGLLVAACGPGPDSATVSSVPASSAAEPVQAEAPLAAPLPMLVNLGADKCIPCRQMVPAREALAAEFEGQLKVTFIDVWADRSAGRNLGIRMIPTQIIVDAEGRERFRHEGYWHKEAIVAKFQELGIALTRSGEDQP